ncbi:hypothetical protein FHL15_000731 [Xylaria flabelliformis]|uniref:BPL/LPL catalytic domain-containing protein n=1 Tax=Xylaria flabelliformis TaxID=2512241 RepID=A0A553IEP9_9PEZI|nr:hypothetical protein FHL15_000731 [Xylaria flabelliformis]
MIAFRHFTLRSNPSALLPQFPSYAFASSMQALLQQELLTWKAQPPTSRGPPPPPSVISFTPTPTYTLGRRQTEPLSEKESARLRAPLFLPTSSDLHGPRKAAYFLPTITHESRGGLTTYHGPGQLVIWPVIDLHSPLHAELSVRDYAHLLEETTIAAVERVWGLTGFTTKNPGVWVRSTGSKKEGGSRGNRGNERKIAALGVHVRRHITSLGVAINYSTPVTGPAETNPWGRIVACGIEDRGVTSACAELGIGNGADPMSGDEKALENLAETWQSEFQSRLKIYKGVEHRALDQSMKELSSLFKGRDDSRVTAHPISNLKT